MIKCMHKMHTFMTKCINNNHDYMYARAQTYTNTKKNVCFCLRFNACRLSTKILTILPSPEPKSAMPPDLPCSKVMTFRTWVLLAGR